MDLWGGLFFFAFALPFKPVMLMYIPDLPVPNIFGTKLPVANISGN